MVTGFGEVDPTEKPYGKECDMWSMGVLLYVMLSKTMPFRAKEVDQLLKQVGLTCKATRWAGACAISFVCVV